MSRPYQFTDRDDKITSPLDRREQNAPAQPTNFKTDVNRTKTQKWVQAKKVSYGGDDWDDYDEDDEYGLQSAVESRPPPPVVPSQTRSFTTPVPGPSQTQNLQRKNSFDQGDERRTFSAAHYPTSPQGSTPSPVPRSSVGPLHVETNVNTLPSQPADSASTYSASGIRQASATSFAPSNTSDGSAVGIPENRRDFSPSAMPPPLKAAAPGPTSPISPSMGPSFVRPADIYRRMEEEQEKERKSMDLQRPSIDSERGQDVANPGALREHVRTESPGQSYGHRSASGERDNSKSDAGYRMGQPLETVAERKSEYGFPGVSLTTEQTSTAFTGLALPKFESGPILDGDLWDSSSKEQKQEVVPSTLQHQQSFGLRTMVNQAFDESARPSKQDSMRSQANTDTSGITRSDTSGTSDISPIMSRVPSSAASALKHAELRSVTPAIAEEPENADRVRTRIPSGGNGAADVTLPFRRELDKPDLNNSPARAPGTAAGESLAGHAAAELRSMDPASREVDLAVAATASGLDEQTPAIALMEKAAQDNFLASHDDMPSNASSKISRAESPSKGRVADLAGRFNEGADSRRNSAHSIESRMSTSSSKDGNSRPPSAHGMKDTLKPLPDRPAAEREVSFRPKLPGAFESYASTSDGALDPPTTSTLKVEDAKAVDPAPTTVKHHVEGKDLSSPTGSIAGPMAALAAAGAAMGAAFQKSVSSGTSETEENKSPTRQRGDIFARPLPPNRLESTASTIPPTPPAKDIPDEGRNAPLFPAKNTQAMPNLQHRDTAETFPGDFESDQIRREIVGSLSPVHNSTAATEAPRLRPSADNRRSEGVLSDYESYWAQSEDEEPRMTSSALPFSGAPLSLKSTKEVPENKPAVELEASTATEAPTETDALPRPAGFLTQRFSWEQPSPAEQPSGTVSTKGPLPVPQASAPATTMLFPSDPLSLNPKLSSEHLQIRNAEPGELPSPVITGPTSDVMPDDSPQSTDAPVSPLRDTPLGPRPPSSHRPQGGDDVRPPSFREILAIKSTSVRIAKYEETRMQFANMDTGLNKWLGTVVSTNPSLRDEATATHRASLSAGVPSPTGARHKATASLTKVFTSQGSSLGAPGSSTGVPEYKPSPASSENRSSSGGLPSLKGKELLNKAGFLGGKGVKEAKGLFAKGKSRLRGGGSEKAPFDSSSSRHGPCTPSSPSSITSVQSWRSSLDSRPPSSSRTSLSSTPLRSSRTNSIAIVEHKAKMIDDYSNARWSDIIMQDIVPITVMTMQMWPNPRPSPPKPAYSTDSRTQKNAQRPQPPSEKESKRLGVLPSRARTNIDTARPSTAGSGSPDRSTQSVVRASNSSSAASSMLDNLPPRLGPGIPLSLPDARAQPGSHQRVVSLLHPGDVIGAASDDDEPISPVSPVDDEDKLPLDAIPSKLAEAAKFEKGPRRGDTTLPSQNSSLRPIPQAGSRTPPLGHFRGSAVRESSTTPSQNSMDSLERSDNSDAEQSAAQRSVSSQPRLPGTTHSNSSFGPSLSPSSHLRPRTTSVSAIDDSRRVSFVSINELKGKERAADLPSAGVTPVVQHTRHIRFDSSTFHPRAKELKLQNLKKQQEAAKAQALLNTKQPQPYQQRHANFQSNIKLQQAPPPRNSNQRANPESGAFTGLRRADSQFDRMAAIANAHRMMREQFDDVLDPHNAPPDLMATETAAKMHAKQEQLNSLMSGAIANIPVPPIPEDRPQSRDGRSRSRAASAASNRSRSKERRAPNSVSPGAREQSATRAQMSPIPRLPPTGGPRASSIPRPESTVRQPILQMFGPQGSQVNSRPPTRDGRPPTRDGRPPTRDELIGGGRSGHSGQYPPLPSPTFSNSQTSAMLNATPNQRPLSYQASVITPIREVSPPLSEVGGVGGGPRPQIEDNSTSSIPIGRQVQNNKSARSTGPPTPSMVITKPDDSPEQPQKTLSAGEQGMAFLGGVRSQASISSLGDASDDAPETSWDGLKATPTSSAKRAFAGRDYSAPVPGKERPMSFVPLARDDRGLPVPERISTAKRPVDPRQEDVHVGESKEGNTATADRRPNPTKPATVVEDDAEHEDDLYRRPDGRAQPKAANVASLSTTSSEYDSADDLYKPPTPTALPRHVPIVTANFPPRESSISPLNSYPSQHRPVQLYDKPFSRDEVPTLGRQPTQQAQQPGPDANPIAALQSAASQPAKKGGLFSKLKGKSHTTAGTQSARASSDANNSTSPSEPRVSSMDSTVASVEDKTEKRKRSSGLFAIKRPGSMGSDSALTSTTGTGSIAGHAGDSPSRLQYLRNSDASVGFLPPSGADRLSIPGTVAPDVVPVAPQRAITTKEQKKNRRKSLAGIFSRAASTNTPGRDTKKPPLPPMPKGTVFHRVPENPEAGTPTEKFSGPRRNYTAIVIPGDPWAPSPTGYYAPEQSGKAPGFVHETGSSGLAAIAAQQELPEKERRSMSLSSGGLFGRRHSKESSTLSLHDRSNSSDTQTPASASQPGDSSLGHSGHTRGGRGVKMGSISETTAASHQERPWAITLPRGEENEQDKEIERREIMHASSARWGRGPDGELYVLKEQKSPTSPGQFSNQTSGTPTSSSAGFVRQGSPANTVHSYTPSGIPSNPIDLRSPYHDQQFAPTSPSRSPPPSRPEIPPLPQGNVPLMQPQPRKTSWSSMNDPRLDPTYRSTGPSRSTSKTSELPRLLLPLTSAPVGGATGENQLQTPTTGSDTPNNRPRPPPKDTPPTVTGSESNNTVETASSTAATRNFIALLEEQRRDGGEHSAMGNTSHRAKALQALNAGLTVQVPVTSGGTLDGPIPLGSMASGNARPVSRNEDDAPVMKATSYPGDEWMPEFYVD